MNEVEAQHIVGSDATVADKIRRLNSAGHSRADIARLLGKRYQHVRNVLEGDKLGSTNPGMAESNRRFEHASAEPVVEDRGAGIYRLLVRDDGSVMLPQSVRQALGLDSGAGVMARLDGEAFTLESGRVVIERVRARLRPYYREGVSWADDLIAKRRREVEREEHGG